MTPKFPTRTVVLMALTLIAFGWFWWQTRAHRDRAAANAEQPIRVQLRPEPVEGATP